LMRFSLRSNLSDLTFSKLNWASDRLTSACAADSISARSEAGRVAVTRLKAPLGDSQRAAVARAARKRLHVFYDTGFDLNSRRQFCSRYVREVLYDATGIEAGDVENFATLLSKNPGADLRFWRLWYFDRIPWRRETVTPASLLASDNFTMIFDGRVTGGRRHRAATRAADSATLAHDSDTS